MVRCEGTVVRCGGMEAEGKARCGELIPAISSWRGGKNQYGGGGGGGCGMWGGGSKSA